MKCQTCPGYSLKPVEVAQGLVGAECSKCGGTSLAMLNLRFWLDQQPDMEATHTSNPEPVQDQPKARQCSKCQRLMTKYTVANDLSNKLDLCHACDEIWLDKGEWGLLEAAGVLKDLPERLSDAGQRALRQQLQEEREKAFFEERIGDDFEKVDAFREWLKSHPNAGEIKRYLMLD